ncbi:MAG TPA: D-alanyl-D-alanine endopeptidase [Steroidobacteraceae bacterium]|nr:D-alanyl-D-alanine endopeptidase [Steroidobacteraceae bacterium]
MAFNSRQPSMSLRAVAGIFLAILAMQASAKVIRTPAKAARDPAKLVRDLKLKSSSVLIMDASDSSVLYSRHSDVPMPIASITKLMTALVVLDANQPLDESIQITDADRDFPKGGVSRLTVGTTLTRGDLMHLALMSSENRAAHALGNNYPGGMSAMVAAMNAKAAELGMASSHFVDPTGLSSQNVASPEDLTKLVIAASHNPSIREYSTDSHYAVKVRRHMVEFRNTDNLVANPTWNIIVQKTGYIAEAGKCLVMAAVIEGRSVVIVLLDSLGKYTRVADAKRIKTWMEASANQRVALIR